MTAPDVHSRIVTDAEAAALREHATADSDRIPDYYFHRIGTLLDTREELRDQAMNRQHYSDNPRTVLHSWNDQEALVEIGGYCGLCAVLARLRGGVPDA